MLEYVIIVAAFIVVNCTNKVKGEINISASPSNSLQDEEVTGIILGSSVVSFFFILIIVVCVKEKCNQKRSVYHKKTNDTPRNGNINDAQHLESSNGISTISQSIK